MKNYLSFGIKEVGAGAYRISSFGGLEFYYGLKPRPISGISSLDYDNVGRPIIDRILPISDGKIETEITDKHESPSHGEHFDIADFVKPIEDVKIKKLKEPIWKMHFDTEGERLDKE